MIRFESQGNTHVLTGKFDLTNVNKRRKGDNSGPKLLFETTEISSHSNSTQQESNYIYLYTTKFGTSIKIQLNRKFESTEFETMRVNCTSKLQKKSEYIRSVIQPTGKQLIAACIFSAYNSVQNDILPTYHFFYLKNKKIIWFSSTSYHKGAPSWP